MPRGADTFTKHKAAIEDRRAEAEAQFGPKADYFSLDGGQFAAVRFLEQGPEVAWASMHRIPVEGRQYPQDVICLDQNDDGTQCPFCQSEFKGIRSRSTKGFYNVIWRGHAGFQAQNQQIIATNAQRAQASQPPLPTYTLGPQWKRNEYGSPEKDPQSGKKIVLGYADGIFLWKASKTVHDLVMSKDATFQGLMSRDFLIRRVGRTKDDTVYYMDPLDVNKGMVPMSDADQVLAQQKYDLDKFITPMSYESAVAMLSGNAAAVGAQDTFNRGGAAALPPSGLPPVPGQIQPGQPDIPAVQPGIVDTPFQQPAPGVMGTMFPVPGQ